MCEPLVDGSRGTTGDMRAAPPECLRLTSFAGLVAPQGLHGHKTTGYRPAPKIAGLPTIRKDGKAR